MAGELTAANQTVLWEYLSERIGLPWSTDLVCIGQLRRGQLVGVVGYNNFTGTSCYMHMAGSDARWVSKALVKEVFRYPFEFLQLAMVFGVVPSGNTQALRIDRKLGFTELMFIPGAHPDGGVHILQLLRENCRWVKHG